MRDVRLFASNTSKTALPWLTTIHLELVRTLAKDSADALGPDYPGPMAA